MKKSAVLVFTILLFAMSGVAQVRRESAPSGTKMRVMCGGYEHTAIVWKSADMEGQVGVVNCGDTVEVVSLGQMTRIRTEDGHEGYLPGRFVGVAASKAHGKKLSGIEKLIEKHAETLHTNHPQWTPTQCQTIANHKIGIGMTTEMVRLAWGRPDGVNTTLSSDGSSHEQWVYESAYVYFDDSIVTTIQY